MNMTSKIFIVSALVCVSTAAAYSQDCNNYLRRATELVSQQKYCEAKSYYQMYGKCNADADVSTEIAMCERRCKIEKMEGGVDEPVVEPRRDNPPSRGTTSDSGTSSGDRPVKPRPSSSTSERFKIGARAGLNLTNIFEKYDGKKPEGVDKAKFKPGFQLGIVADYSISDNLAIQPGFLFATQGYVYKYSETGYSSKESYNFNYLQIPVNVQYKMDMSDVILLLQAGPYLGYAFSGKYKSIEKEDGETYKESESIKFGSKEDDMKPLDFGLGFGLGLQFGNIQAGLGFNMGLMNLSNEPSEYKNSQKNYGLALTLTYLFGK